MAWKIYCFVILLLFVLLRIVDASLTSYAISNFDHLYELNPMIKDPTSFFSVLLSPFPLIMNLIGLVLAFTLFLVEPIFKKYQRIADMKFKFTWFAVDSLLFMIVVSLVAVINNSILIFVGGWERVALFSTLFKYSEILPLACMLVISLFTYNVYAKPKAKNKLSELLSKLEISRLS